MWFYILALYNSWTALLYRQMCRELLQGLLLTPSAVMQRWDLVVDNARKRRPFFAWLSDLGFELLLAAKPKK